VVFFITRKRHDMSQENDAPGASGFGRSTRIIVSTIVTASGLPSRSFTTTSR